jgi:hypothetical protein
VISNHGWGDDALEQFADEEPARHRLVVLGNPLKYFSIDIFDELTGHDEE